MEHYWDKYRLQRGYRPPIRLFDRKKRESPRNGELLLLQHVPRLHEPYGSAVTARNYAGELLLLQHVLWLHEPHNSAVAACNHAGEQLLQLHVPRLHEPHNSAVTACNYAGEQLLQLHVLPLYKNQIIYHGVWNIYQVVPHTQKRNRDNSFRGARVYVWQYGRHVQWSTKNQHHLLFG